MDIVTKTYNALHKLRLEVEEPYIKEELNNIAQELKEKYNYLDFIDEESAEEILEHSLLYVPSKYNLLIADNINTEREIKDFASGNCFITFYGGEK